jgi:hypothetical protein
MNSAGGLASLMEPAARLLLGEANRALSSKKELRYGTHGSVAVNLQTATWYDFEANEGGGLLDLVERRTGFKHGERLDWLRRHVGPLGRDWTPPAPAPRRLAKPKDDNWRHLWDEARTPTGTLVELHLTHRHLGLPDTYDIRFHPSCPFGKNAKGDCIYVPAMVALVRHIITNEPQGVHRTALDLQGNQRRDLGKNGRLSLGRMIDGAIKLTPDEHVTIALGVAEGVETALSLQQLPEWFGSPVWSLLYAGNLGNLPVLPGIETLAVAVDRDRAGEDAARKVSQHWRAAGLSVFFAKANTDGEDINDVVARRE